MKAILQNVKTGAITIDQIPAPIVRPGAVLVRNVCSLVSAGTEKSVLEFSKSNYLQKARQRPDLVRKVLQRAKNEGLWQTYQIVSNLIDQPIAVENDRLVNTRCVAHFSLDPNPAIEVERDAAAKVIVAEAGSLRVLPLSEERASAWNDGDLDDAGT